MFLDWIVFFFFVVTIVIILVLCTVLNYFSSKNKCPEQKQSTIRHQSRNDQGNRPGDIQHMTDGPITIHMAGSVENVQQCVRNERTTNETDINEQGTNNNTNAWLHSQTYVGTSSYLPIIDAVSFLLRLSENNATEDVISITIETESADEPPAYEDLPYRDTELSIDPCRASALTLTRVSNQPPAYDELPSQHIDSREFILRHTGGSIEPPSLKELACQHIYSSALNESPIPVEAAD